MIKANLLHLSYNMWGDTLPPPGTPPARRDTYYHPRLRCSRTLWRECIRRMARAGLNMAVIDLGDGVRYKTHPEIAVTGAWTRRQLRDELACCREQGIEPVPKLNFSACHDAWLGPHARMLSTPRYYAVCRELIEEVCEAFDGPRFFHLGMDEETFQHQRNLQYVVIRQGALWWHDLNLLIEEVRRCGSTAWMWSDVLWNCERGVFRKNVPRGVLQSNWYYGAEFPADDSLTHVSAFRWLEEMGYRQVPTGSTWSCAENYPRLVEHCTRCVSAGNLLGFMMADWRPMTSRWRSTHLDAVAVAEAAHASLPQGE